MMHVGLPPPLFAQATSRLTFEFARLESFTHPLHWAGLIAVGVGLLAYVVYMYKKDSVDLHPALGVTLTVLRLAALAGILAVYLQPQWRSEQDKVHNSQVLLLADTSLSMGLTDKEAPTAQAGPSRGQQIATALADGELLGKLRQVHDVIVLRFDQDLAPVVRLPRFPPAPDGAAGPQSPTTSGSPGAPTDPEVAWDQALAPRGLETQIGRSLQQLLHDHRSGPVAGIVLFTDGGQNAGPDASRAIKLAQQAEIAVFPVGIGSDRRPINVQVSNLLAPARAYPGDAYTVTGYIQAQGLSGRTVTVELTSRPSGAAAGNVAAEQVEGSEEVSLGADGEVLPVTFQVTPSEAGQRTLALRVQAPNADHNPRDNLREADIEVVDRQTRVLLFAGGPTREYIFLRNLLSRDDDVAVDILLQTAQPGISQDADAILDEFPTSREALFAYDAIVAFDPNWEELPAAEIKLLDQWVGEQGGGMIVIAGPVHTDMWAQNKALATIRALYPVEFHRRVALLDDARFGATEPWPIDFTRAGLEAEFLWLDDTGPLSQQAWAAFPGVYGYYSVKGPKPGATVYGHYSDPRATEGQGKPVLVADQFYGSGRVLYLGTGEMWRLRGVDEAYFEQFYTKAIRHVSQGRLLRGSSRGVLLVEQDHCLLGSTVALRAQVTNAQLEPLAYPTVPLEVYLPNGAVESIQLSQLAGSPGTYTGQISVYQEGSYRLELPVPDSRDDRLTRRIQVKLPDLESENPQRNDPLLSEIAQQTGGHYYVGLPAVMGTAGNQPLWELLPDRRKILPVTGGIDRVWDQKWLTWMMCAICGLLCLEWLIRRLTKLA